MYKNGEFSIFHKLSFKPNKQNKVTTCQESNILPPIFINKIKLTHHHQTQSPLVCFKSKLAPLLTELTVAIATTKDTAQDNCSRPYRDNSRGYLGDVLPSDILDLNPGYILQIAPLLQRNWTYIKSSIAFMPEATKV